MASNTWNTALATFPLDYTRGEVVGGSCDTWEPWISTYDGDFENCSPSPLLSSLDFDVDGSMIMAFTDRYTLQKFTFQRNLTDTQSETVINGGDLLRASLDAGSFVLESAGTTANGGGCGANGEGPNGGEYYCGDLITPDHFETVMGAIAILPGTEDAIVTVMNPIDGTFNSGGVKMFNNNDGTSADGYLLYQTTTFPGGNGNAVKGGGLGDIELLKDPAPVEICSYLWMDSDNDGSYDAGETGLIGIEVSLMATDGTTVGTTTTDANGGFCFNNNLEYFTDYYLAIGTNGDFNTTTGIIQDSLSLTFPNNTSGLTAELHDSDAIIASGVNPSVDGYPYLAFNSGGGGMNTNDLATGFSVLDCPVIDSPSAPQTICSGDTITSLQIGTDATEADAIAFVYFADQQTGSDMYVGGIPLDTVTPAGGLAIINDIVLPANGTASDEDYFIYAITNPVSGDVNCRPFQEIIITVSPAPNVSVTSNSPICEGADIMLNENGGLAVDWNWQGPAFSAGSIQNPTILNASATDNGMYYVTITDAAGCINVDSIFVSVTGTGSISFGNTGPFCVMQTPSNITATPSGGTFSGTGITDGALGTFDPAIAGTGLTTITYNFTDGNGCSGSATVDVTVLASPTVTLDPIGPFCVTDPDTLLVGLPAGGTYTGVGIIDGMNGRFDPGVAGPGTHTISYTFTNAQNCSETATADITVGAIPSVQLDGAGPFCRSNPPVILTGTPAGGLFYGTGITDTMGGVFDPSQAVAGSNMIQYVFHHPDGCSNSAFTEIIVPVPNIQITAAGPYCSTDAAVILNATPAGGTFSGTGITNGASGIFDPVIAGAGDHIITYDYTDGNGCLGTGTTTITVSDCNGNFGDFVWMDNNNNGIQEIGEPGFNNLTVNLYDANTDMLLNTTTTDNMGMYMFTGLTSGDFYIIFDTTGIGEQYAFSPMDIGSDDLDSDANSAGQTPDFMGTAGFDVLNIDAGLVPVADLGDFVFNDLNNDGIQDVGEPGIEGVTVNLYDANTDIIIATVVTDANGNYVFDRIPPGDYYVGYDPTTNVNGNSFVFAPQDATTDDLDSDINPSTGFTPTFTFDPTAGDNTDIDAGFIQAGSIGDFVFADYNGDGIQDPGEPGIAGVMVVLNDNIGVPLDTVFTDVNGNYTISGVTADDYFVSFDITTNTDGNTFLGTPINATTDDLDSDIDPVAARTAVFTFDPTAGNDIDTDAGFIPVMTIGDFVWLDLNEDGIQDLGEPGIEGVTVTLFNSSDDSVFSSTTTNSMGIYNLTNIPSGGYYLGFDETTNTNGYTLTTSPQDNFLTTEALDSDIDQSINMTGNFITDPLNGDDFDIDAGFYQSTIFSIGNFVWQDNNGDGIQDVGEPGLDNVDVFLADAATDALVGSATTDASGAYQIDNVPPGNYYIFFDNSNYATYNFSPQDATTDDLDSDADAGGQTANFTITNANNFDFDAGLIPNIISNTIGDFVFEDLNGDGIQDVGEPGIEGVTVTLFDDNDVQITTTSTDASGAYVFTNIPAGDYYVNFDASTNTAGNTFNATLPGTTTDDLDSDINPVTGNTAIFTFDPTAPDNDIDAGFYQPVVHNTIGDFVFEDLNEDGIQDLGEPGIEGVTVRLYDNNDVLIATTTTDAAGAYIFTAVPAGDYYVNFDATTNTAGNTLTASPQDATTDDLDSDVDPATGNTATFTFDPSGPNDDIDAGFYQPAVPTNTIGDFVFEDLNEDGIQDLGEPGIEGVTVRLYDNNDVLIATTTTDATGAYTFTAVPAGDYYVNFDATTNTAGNTLTASPQDATTDDLDSDVDPATGNTATFTFDPSGPNDDIDAGFYQPAVPTNTIGDFVFQDLNGDGIQDVGEPGIEGVTVTLFDDNNVQIAMTTTDASGAYVFSNIPAGDYYVNFDATTNTSGNTFINSPPSQTTDDLDSDVVDQITGNTATFTFDALGPNNNIDAGFIPTNTIGDFVFEDLNEDGFQDVGEPGIEGVTVTLFDDNNIQIATTTTDASGAYVFNNIPVGDYYVNFDATTNTGGNTFANSPQDATTDDLDSDADPTTGNTTVFTFDGLAPNNDIDAGFFQGCPVIDAGPDVTICEGTATQLNATLGGTIYLWTPTATLDNPGSPTPVASPIVTTTYIVNVSGTCSGTDSVTVFVNPQPVIDMVNSVDPSACDAMDGSIQITTSGGQAPLQYSIDGGVTFSTNNTFNNLISGNYDVVVANSDSTCMSPVQVVTLTQQSIVCPVLFSGDTLLVADGRAPTICVPVSIDDTMNYEITVNGALYTDPIIGCTVDTLATPGMEINLGGIGIYEIAFNNTSTCCQDTLTLAVQGTIEPDTLFEVTPFETTTTTLCADTSDLVGNFSTLSLCQTPANGMANLDGSSCITYTPNTGFVGTDTLCLVACDVFGACDTTVMFLQVQPEMCPDFITLENEMITLTDCGDNGTICVNIDLTDLSEYSIFDNGAPYAGGIQACQIDTLTYYDYSGLPGAGLTGPYMIDNWTVNGVNFSGMVADMESLKDSMNVWDPTGNWVHVPANNEIRHIMTTDVYSRFDLTETVSSAPGIMNAQQRNQPVDIELTFGAGTHEVIFRESATGCEDTVNVSLTCQCPPLFAVDTITVPAANCNEMSFYCTPILLTEFINYNVSDNGNPYTQQIQGCDFDSLIIYNYDNFPNQGNSGPYELDSWIVDGQTFSMNFNTIQELVDAMNAWDTNGNWFISNNFSIDGGDLTRNYGPITIVQFGITVAVSPADLQPTPSKVSLPLPIGFHELVFENTNTGCIDTIYVNAECDDCPEYFMEETLTLDAGDCIDSTELCIAVLPADIANYTITDNGAIYNNGFAGCDFDSIQSYLTVTFNNPGVYQLDSWMISGVMFGPVSFTDPAALVDSINVIDPTGNWNYSGLLITGGSSLNNYGDLTISENSNPLVTLSPSPILRSNGTAMRLDTGFHMVIVTDDITGCTDTVAVQVDCTPTPLCPDFISTDSQLLTLEDCNDLAIACVPVSINDATRFAITDNGMTYGNLLTACGADTVLTYETENVPGSGPYDLEDWTVNGTMFSGQFADLVALTDSMNLWDTGSSWTYDLVAETITGANSDNTYGTLNIRQLLTNSLTILPTVDAIVGGGTNIELAAGLHEMIFERPDGCTDTIAITVDCLNPDTILANLVIGITDTICLDTSDLAGNIIDIDNVCPDASGTSTSVNFLDGFTCIEVTGMEVGMDTACIVMCDDLGVCDTTTFVFNTTSNQVSSPTASRDTANTIINTAVDIVIVNNDDAGNQMIDTFYIVAGPDNGVAFLDGVTGLLTYIPDTDYCDDVIPDTLTYGLCNALGCDTSTVTVYVACDTISDSELIIHNGFSPNNDGVNDVFMIQGLRNIPNNTLCVFNRWGNQVYRKDAYGYNENGQYDENTLWDGSWTGQVLPDGTYFYLLEDGNGNRHSGYIQIHR